MKWFSRGLWAALTGTAYLTVATVLWILGWIVVPLLAVTRSYEMCSVPRYGRTLLCWKYRWAWLWGNDENGIDGLGKGWAGTMSWAERTKDMSAIKRIILWSGWRNPVCNLRFVWPFGMRPPFRRGDLEWIGNTAIIDSELALGIKRFLWHFTWLSGYAGVWVAYRGYYVRIGWKINPTDRYGLELGDYRAQGIGFALQPGRVK